MGSGSPVQVSIMKMNNLQTVLDGIKRVVNNQSKRNSLISNKIYCPCAHETSVELDLLVCLCAHALQRKTRSSGCYLGLRIGRWQ